MNQPAAETPASGLPATARMQHLLSGFATSQALYVVAELGVATALLEGPRTVADLAEATGSDEDSLRRIIRFLAPLEVFHTDQDMITITDLGRTLADGPHESVRDMARYWMRTHYVPFSSLLETTRTGKTGATEYLGQPFFDWVNESPELAALQNAAMSAGGRATRGDVLENYRLPPGETVADIGGADGTLLTALLADDSARRGIVFDLPTVVAAAAETVARAGLRDRVTVVEGDFFESVPAADVYLMSFILHDWDNPSAVRILRSIAKAAPAGARLVLLEMVMPEGDGAHFTKVIDLVMLAMLGGRERTEIEWRSLLAEEGFTVDRIVAGSGAFSIIEATLA